jgi:DNA polymerase III subunit gamma/tau
MAFVVTARKWRPQLFEDVVGQQHISTTLKNAIENDRIGHAYIFAGPRGVGKTTTARILAKRLNCEKPNGGEPCNNCSSCNNFLKSQSLDIIEIDGASNRRIDEIRTLRESVKYAPTSGQYKVYIIDEVHMLTTESFNALLKTLEEPPEHTIFIFATTDIHKVPLTIISRCQRFDFRRIELDEIKTLLQKIADDEKIEIYDDSLTLIAKKADGALRDAESIFDQVVSFCGNKVDVNILKQMLNLIDDEIYFQISEAILNKNFKVAFEISEMIYSNGWNFIDFVNGMLEHFRNISTVVITKKTEFIESSEGLKTRYLDYADKYSEGDLLRILAFISKTQNELKITQNQKLKIEISLIHLIGFEKSSTITELLTKSGNLDTLTAKKKTEFVNNSPQDPKSSKKSKPTLKIDLPKPIIREPKTVQSIVKPLVKENTENKDTLRYVGSETIDSILGNWESFKSTITKERFLLGPLLEHTYPVSLENDILFVDVNHKEDVQILISSNDFLSKRYTSIYKTKLQMKFKYNKIAIPQATFELNNETVESDDSYKDHPIVKSILSELGGREIK